MGVLAMTVENWEKVTMAQPEPLEKGAKMEEAPGAPLCWLRWAVEGIDTGQMAVLSSAFRIFMVCSVFFCWSEAGMRVGRKLSVKHCRAWSMMTAASCVCRTVSRENRWFERKVGLQCETKGSKGCQRFEVLQFCSKAARECSDACGDL